ncbi:Nodulation protein D 2 [Serratia marcescens]|uniref:LysR family transcriptional regulator n=1 Tax=Serratia marcescens TaxID=615 RepID=UPI0021772227|nr:LysR family transcriptional regulator [Serratia marcescens]CAI1837910.1 Nodulation protein D 2 [Serratia marcescens]
MRPDLNMLYALEALLEEGSVVGAARRMNLSPPAMSRALGRIRHTVGDPILVPSGRELVPTPRAIEIRDQLKDALQQATAVLAKSGDIDLRRLEARFNVRANDIFIGIYAGKLLDIMQTQMPYATLCFTPEENDVDNEALRTGRIDHFISASRPFGKEMHVQPLFSTHMVGVVGANHPILAEDITPASLVRWGHIGVSRRGKNHGPLDEALARHGLARKVALVVPTPSSALLALNATDFILSLPEQLAHAARQAGLDIATFKLPVALADILITQTWHPRHQHDPAHQWLRRTIRTLTESRIT